MPRRQSTTDVGARGTGRRGLWRDFMSIGLIVGLLGLVYLLPPDTTLAAVERSGSLRVCVPDTFPPLVRADADEPGIDIELLRVIADRMGVRLQLIPNSAMGRDFNPRNWRVTRAQCLVLAGGVVASPATRSFLETSTAYLSTGWAAVTVDPDATLQGATVGFYAGVAGLDRIALSRFLQGFGTQIIVVPTRSAFIEGLESGRFAIGVTEALTARTSAAEVDGHAMWLPDELARHPIAFGLWKGDFTLKRRLNAEVQKLHRDGTISDILAKYDVTPIDAECRACR
jgi:ABC-type amino acid transport substrate-binding protein